MLRLIKVDSKIFNLNFSQSKDKIDDMPKLSNVRANGVQIRTHENDSRSIRHDFPKKKSKI